MSRAQATPSNDLTAKDLMPLVWKLPRTERVRLAALALAAREPREFADRAAYTELRPHEGEFSSDDDPLARDAEGWEAFADAAR